MEQLKQAIEEAQHVVVLTGAEVSAASGLPAFRMTRAAYRERPAEIWNWYAARREIVRTLEPNAVHRAVAAFAARRPGRVSVVTQNVDDLQQRAGTPRVISLHGNLMEDEWLLPPGTCCNEAAPLPGAPPRCAACGNLRRPNVTWVDESPSSAVVEAATAAIRAADATIAIGDAGLIAPATELVALAAAAGQTVVSISAVPSAIDALATQVVRGKVAEVVPALLG